MSAAWGARKGQVKSLSPEAAVMLCSIPSWTLFWFARYLPNPPLELVVVVVGVVVIVVVVA